MNSNSTLVSIGKFDLKLNHLLIIGILALSFSISFLIRSQPADWGWELNEFDPFFNYRATQYLVENGPDAYFQWHDELSWYPNGRNVSQTSQTMLHLTAAGTYWIFGGNSDLYDFTILFPVIFGSLSAIVLFALVRVIGGTTAGLFAALFFSFSMPVIIRGTIGWFKSEPLGLFFGLFAVYFFLSGLKSKNHKIAASKLIASGIVLGFSFASWGGTQFFVIPIALFVMSLPFLEKNNKFLFWSIPLFIITTLLVSTGFERPGIQFLTGLGGMSLIIPTIVMIILLIIKTFSSTNQNRNMLLFLSAVFIVISSLFMITPESLPSASFRYLNAINPFLTTTEPLVDSVSEHATTSLKNSFIFHSILMIFAGLGIWLLLKNPEKSKYMKSNMIVFSLIFALVGVYSSSAFVRLELFASVSIIILSSLGLSILSKEFFSNQNQINNIKNLSIKSCFVIGIIALLIIPLTFPATSSVFALTDAPPTMLNGGTSFSVTRGDWNDSLEWIKNNTPRDAVVASWWDYGYWIQTKADRATLADNSTLSTVIIEKIARMFISSPDQSWQLLQDSGADYFVVFLAGQRLSVDGNDGQPLYALQGGGDESKKQWFIKIAKEPLNKYILPDAVSGTEHFWNDTMMGKMTPFELIGYLHPQTNQQSLSYQPGFVGIYEKNIKFPKDGNGPLKLVYSSPSFDGKKGELLLGVFVYEVNKDYVPQN